MSNIVKKLVPAVAAVFVLAVAVLLLTRGDESDVQVSNFNENGDLLISAAEVSSTAGFYPVEIDGTILEVLAVRASDGTVRTAFNTCQICYGSGRGYYEQEGDKLVCQNCGNRFGTDDVEVMRGGCNPIPITAEYKEVDGDTIAVSGELLALAKDVFSNWRATY